MLLVNIDINSTTNAITTNPADLSAFVGDYVIDISENLAAMLLNVDISYEAKRNVTFAPATGLGTNTDGNVKVQTLALAPRATALETIPAGRLVEYIEARAILALLN